MRNALFDAEDVGFAPAIPAAEFGAGEEEGYEEEEDGGVTPAGAAAGVGGFDFCWCAKGFVFSPQSKRRGWGGGEGM